MTTLLEAVHTTSDYYNEFLNNVRKYRGPFVGPQPAQILPKDLYGLMKDSVLTPKIDGVRYLCVIDEDILFINRSMVVYRPKCMYLPKQESEIPKLEPKIPKLEPKIPIQITLEPKIKDKEQILLNLTNKFNESIARLESEKLERIAKLLKIQEINRGKLRSLVQSKDYDGIMNLKKEIQEITPEDFKKIDIEFDKKNKDLELKYQLRKKNIIKERIKKVPKLNIQPSILLTKTHKSSKIKTMKINFKFKGIFDCEVVENKNGVLQVFLFDIVMLNDYKVYKLPFMERMEFLQYIKRKVNRIDFMNNKLSGLPVKFYFKQFFNFPEVLSFKETSQYRIVNKIDTQPDSEMTMDKLESQYSLKMNFEPWEKPEYDGVIFINTNYRYYLGEGFARGQYKWKPKEHLTIDLKLQKKSNKWIVVGKAGKEITIDKKNMTSMLDTSNLKDEYNEKVYEFLYDGSKIIIVSNEKGEAKEREKGANAYKTIMNTIIAYKTHFSLEDFLLFFEYCSNENTELSKKHIKWMDKESALIAIDMCYSYKPNRFIPINLRINYTCNDNLDTKFGELFMTDTRILINEIVDLVKSKLIKTVYFDTLTDKEKEKMTSYMVEYIRSNLYDMSIVDKLNKMYPGFGDEHIRKLEMIVNINNTISKKQLDIGTFITSQKKYIRVSIKRKDNSDIADIFYRVLSFLQKLSKSKRAEGVNPRIVKNKYIVREGDTNYVYDYSTKNIWGYTDTIIETISKPEHDLKIETGCMTMYSRRLLESELEKYNKVDEYVIEKILVNRGEYVSLDEKNKEEKFIKDTGTRVYKTVYTISNYMSGQIILTKTRREKTELQDQEFINNLNKEKKEVRKEKKMYEQQIIKRNPVDYEIIKEKLRRLENIQKTKVTNDISWSIEIFHTF